MQEQLSLSEKVAQYVVDKGIEKEGKFEYKGVLSDRRSFSVNFNPGQGIGNKVEVGKLRCMEIELKPSAEDQIGYSSREVGAQVDEVEQGLNAKLSLFMAISYNGNKFTMPFYKEKIEEGQKAAAEYIKAVLEPIHERISPVTINLKQGELVEYSLQDLTGRAVFNSEGRAVLVVKTGLWVHDKNAETYYKFNLIPDNAGKCRVHQIEATPKQQVYILYPCISEGLILLEEKLKKGG